MLPNVFADGIIIVCVILGVLLIICPVLKGARNIWAEQQMYKYEYGLRTQTHNQTNKQYDFDQSAVVSTNSNAINASNCNVSKNKTYDLLPFEDDSQL